MAGAREMEKEKDGRFLVILPAVNLPSLEEITEMENQPTPDFISELMQVVCILEKIATTSKNLNGVYVRALRLAALKVHAGTNLLARRLHEQAGGNTNETLADLRRRNRALQLEKKRMEQEAKGAVQTRRELKKTRRKLEDMRRENKDLEQELREIKARCVGGKSPSTSPSPPLLHLSIPSPAAEEARGSPARSGSRSAPPPPGGGGGTRFRAELFPPPNGGEPAPMGIVQERPLEPVKIPLPRDTERGTAPGEEKEEEEKKKKMDAPPYAVSSTQEEQFLRQHPTREVHETENPTWAMVVRRRKKTDGGERSRPPLQQPPVPAKKTPTNGSGGGPPLPKRTGRRARPFLSVGGRGMWPPSAVERIGPMPAINVVRGGI